MFNESLVLEYFEKLRKERIKYSDRELKVESLKGKAIAIIGPRRAGKTYFLLHRFLNNISSSLYADMESIEFSAIKPEDFIKIISLYKAKYTLRVSRIFLDEIQNIQNWQSLVRTLLNRNYEVFITDSSSKLLSKEIATQLRGRTLTYLLLPFSFREFLSVRKIKIEKYCSESEIQKIKLLLREYLKYGSFPEVIFSKSKERILKEYFDTIFYKDFVERHSIKSLTTARTIFEYLFQNFSKEISIEKIKNYIKNQTGVETKSTIYSYIDKISDTLALFFIDKYSRSIYKRRSWPKKVYICDVGISLF